MIYFIILRYRGRFMSKKNIQIVIAFSFMALLGTVSIQYYWISKIYQQNHLLFDQNANRALKYAIQSIENEENILFANNILYSQQLIISDTLMLNLNESQGHIIQVTAQHQTKLEDVEEKMVKVAELEKFYGNDSLSENKIFINNKSKHKVEIISINDTLKIFGAEDKINTYIHIEINNDSIIHHFEAKSDSLIRILKYRNLDLEKEQLELEATVEQLVWEMDKFSRPFANNIPKEIIQKVLEKVASEYQLPLEFDFALIMKHDSIVFSSKSYSDIIKDFTYSSNLFPNELISRNQSLSIQFNNNPLYIKLFVPIALSLAFTLILFFGFVFIIKNMLHHRNLSKMKTDFINNMTHEFKTPIASISLASDSIILPSIINNQEKVEYFTGMIKKENKRMNRLVEKILQMARLENKELELEKTEIDVHQILNLIIENTQMKLKGKGQISFQKNTEYSFIIADQDHLTNVIYNLIDNAIKYSTKTIDIQIKSYLTKSMFCLSISDKGNGIDKKDLPHIFERFYRIESGNIHNVKGYGLGLTYVKAIIEKHQGQILVNSEMGKGSTFEIRLPIIIKTKKP